MKEYKSDLNINLISCKKRFYQKNNHAYIYNKFKILLG